MDDGCANILLLGETGTGKSTFINSLANYLKFRSLEAAENGNAVCVIPAKFTITSEDGELVDVHFDKDSNEDSSIGSSSTQDAHAYVFAYRNVPVRIIDTPGMNDSRGAIKDAENLEGILRHIRQYKHLHAVCVLLKPDVTVLTAAFKYCLLELLSRLDRSAARNIVFVFTRTRSTEYQAPDTLGCLRKLASEVLRNEGAEIPLRYRKAEWRNCFFLDNEGFKYLVARRKGLRLGSASGLKESWKVSQDASWQLLDYVLGKGERPALKPHRIQDTVSVNSARQLISSASQQFGDITQVVQDNINQIHEHTQGLEDEIVAVDELQKNSIAAHPTRLHFVLKIDRFKDPVMVCTSPGCAETYTIAGSRNRWITRKRYKQVCEHFQPLGLGVIPWSLFPGIFGFWPLCGSCGCMHSEHVVMEAEVLEKEKALERRAAILADLENDSEDLMQEQTTVAVALVKFAYFLRKNAICPINDAYEDYLDCLIQTENKAPSDNVGKERLESYKTMKEEHVKQKRLLGQAEELAKEDSRLSSLVTYADLVEISEELKKLPGRDSLHCLLQ